MTVESDPIRFQVIRSALTQVAEEMAVALRRSAYSTNVKTRQDFSCAFFDRDVRPVAQAFTQPVHLGSFVELVPRSLKIYGEAHGDDRSPFPPRGKVRMGAGENHAGESSKVSPSPLPSPAGRGDEAERTHGSAPTETRSGGRVDERLAEMVYGLGPGDMLVVNDPYSGGVHLNDVTVFGPVHHDGELVGYVASLAHHVDVGGGAPASIGPFREIFQEGIIIPPVKLVSGGVIDDNIFRLILAQIRSKRVTAGDFRAQVAANKVGARRIADLVAKYGRGEFDQYVDEVLEYTSRRTAAGIAELPRGTFTAKGFVDFDGFSDEVVNLSVSITVGDDGVLFDMTGCDPQRRAPVNASLAMTFSACAYTLRAMMDPDLPVNHGFYRHIRLIAPQGTVVNATHPAPIVGGWETQVRLNDLMFKALAVESPDRIAAGCKAMMAQAGFGMIDRGSGEYHCNYEALAGGYGARSTKDGPDAVQQHGQNTENAPVEEIESHFPMRISRLSLIEDSDGPGRFRGGLGLRRDYFFPDDPATFTILSDRDIEGPHGLFGGLPGRKAAYVLNPEGEADERRQLTSKCVIDLEPGDTVSFQTPGGGGFGEPWERDPALVLRDVLNGKVSEARAREIYRVAVDVAGQSVDEHATAILRCGR